MADTNAFGSVNPGMNDGRISSPEQLTVLPDGSTPVPLGSGVTTSVLGEGGAAIVYEIWNEQLGVKRAVKVLRPNALPQSFERFSTEVRITAQLRHPNIIEVHTVGFWNRLPYIEMERLEGSSLDKIIQKYGALPPVVAMAIGLMICRALKYTHNHDYTIGETKYKGILHRDLKPANTMISDSGLVKLMDFGIATPADASMHTMEGTFVGSLQYLAPEQLDGRKASPSSDLYAFGAMMYEMLTGVQAFSERNMTRLISMRLKNVYKPLQKYHLRLNGRLLKLINSCMAFDREKRQTDAARVLSELEAIYGRAVRRAPEEIIELYLRQAQAGGKRTIAFSRGLPLGRIAAVIIISGALGAAGYYGWKERETLSEFRITTVHAPDDSIAKSAAAAETVFVTKEIPAARQSPARTVAALSEPARKTEVRSAFVYKAPARQSSAVSAPAPAPAEARRKLEPSFLVLLTQKYGTDDLVAIMALETNQGNHASALKVYDSLSSGLKTSKRAQLYRMKSLQGVGNTSALGQFFTAATIADGDYYLVKAQYLYGQKRFADALQALSACRSSPAEFTDPKVIEREAVYYKALTLTGIASAEGGEKAHAAALEAWYDLKFALRTEQNHRYFRFANDQIRAMTAEPEERRR